jgi:glycosyltransferase involved in cell wall biosynthesis
MSSRMARTPIIFLLLQLPNRANGGIESISQVLMHLQRFRPVVITNRDNERTRQWREAGIETHLIPETVWGSAFRKAPLQHARTYLEYGRAISRIASSTGARLLHANDPISMQLAFAPTKLGRVRMITCMRNMPDPAIDHSRRKFRALFDASDHLLFLSEDMADRWRGVTHGWRPGHTVTYSIVDESFFDRPRTRDSERPFVLIPARITPTKRQLEFIEQVAPSLIERGLRVVIAGDAAPRDLDYERACRAAAERLGPGVEFAGYRQDMAALYSQATLVVIASRLEGLARAMIESMSCACPVVSFDLCSAKEVLDSGGGTIVDVLDWAAMTNAILAFARDEAMLERAGEIGRTEARRLFNASEVIARYEHAYDVAAEYRR